MLYSIIIIYAVRSRKKEINVLYPFVSLLSDFPKDLIYVPCGNSQDWIVRLPSLNALHNKKEDSKVPNVYFSEPSI